MTGVWVVFLVVSGVVGDGDGNGGDGDDDGMGVLQVGVLVGLAAAVVVRDG